MKQPEPSVPVASRVLLACATLFLVVGSFGSFGPGAGASTTEGSETAPAELAREITSDPSYQTALPDQRSEEPPLPGNIGVPGWLASLARLLMIALIAVVVLLLVAWAVTELGRGRSRTTPTPASERKGVEPLLGGFEPTPGRLAEQARFGEAIHALLLVAIRRLVRREIAPPGRALTSREILRRLDLDPQRRSAFADLVRSVELSHFGGADVGADDYAKSVHAFRGALGEEPS